MNNLFRLTSSCILCGDSTNQPISLCIPCKKDLPVLGNTCVRCGLPMVDSFHGQCGQCQKIPPAIDYSKSLYYYKSPIDYLIGQLKFEEKLSCASILGYLLSGLELEFDEVPDVIVPVPLHNKRLSKRGFNQSLEIAKPVALKLGIPIDYRVARRTKPTIAQAKLGLSLRNKNIKNCFKIQADTRYKHVLLIDDVITTGSTINELARTLKKTGVETVGVWSIARATLN